MRLLPLLTLILHLLTSTQVISIYAPQIIPHVLIAACDRENPQTKELCAKLGIHNPWGPFVVKNPDEIDLSDDDDDIDTERAITGCYV